MGHHQTLHVTLMYHAYFRFLHRLSITIELFSREQSQFTHELARFKDTKQLFLARSEQLIDLHTPLMDNIEIFKRVPLAKNDVTIPEMFMPAQVNNLEHIFLIQMIEKTNFGYTKTRCSNTATHPHGSTRHLSVLLAF